MSREYRALAALGREIDIHPDRLTVLLRHVAIGKKPTIGTAEYAKLVAFLNKAKPMWPLLPRARTVPRPETTEAISKDGLGSPTPVP